MSGQGGWLRAEEGAMRKAVLALSQASRINWQFTCFAPVFVGCPLDFTKWSADFQRLFEHE
jgi:hypothetical protein